MIHNLNENFLDSSDYEVSDFLDKWKAKREARLEAVENSGKSGIGQFISRTPIGRVVGTVLNTETHKDIKDAKTNAVTIVKEEKAEAKAIKKEEKAEEKAAKQRQKLELKQIKTDSKVPTFMKPGAEDESELIPNTLPPSIGGTGTPENSNKTLIIVGVVILVVVIGGVVFLKSKK